MRLKWLIVAGCYIAPLAAIGQSNTLKPAIANLPITDPTAAGFNVDSLKNLVQLVRSTPPPDFRGLVVIKDNKLVVEEYFNTYWRETIHDIRSAGKGVTALLMGIAIDKGLVKSVDQSIYDFFPAKEFKFPANRPDIRIKHLLTMTAGFDADDETPGSPGVTGNWIARKDWAQFALMLPMKYAPGEKYVYTDVCPMLIGAIIERTSGKKLADFANENLFRPLGIREYYWYTGVGGSTGPMGNLYLSTLDFAKLGLLVLNKGKWNNRQVISSTWTEQIAIKRSDVSDSPFATHYGYFWFISSIEVKGKNIDFFFASGNGGNLLIVIPSYNMVVALTSSAYGPTHGHSRSRNIFKLLLRGLR